MLGERKQKIARMVLPALLLLAVGLSVALGEMGAPSLAIMWQTLCSKMGGGGEVPSMGVVFWELRLPRALLGLLVGANIAVSGALMQSFFRNPLAEPYVAGVSSGAAAGAVVVLTTGVASMLPAGVAVSVAAFGGASLAAWLVFRLATARGHTSTLMLLLGGIAIGGLLQAVTSGLLLRSDPNDMRSVIFWLMGSLAYRGWEHVVVVAAGAFIGLTVSLCAARPLDLLAAGGDSATYLGLPVQLLRRVVMATACFLAATSVAACGIISFVGLMAPHIVRMLFGARHSVLIPQSALLGALLLTVADLAARRLMPGQELPIGIITGVLGTAFLFTLLLGRRRRFDTTD